MPSLINKLKTGFCILLLLPAAFCFSQQNSPWKKLSNQTISDVYFGLGRHQYSLTNGQGYSVYLKNYGINPVIESGRVVAKTLCGNEVSTSFSTTLQPNQESSGGNYSDSTNSQTGVVTKEDCIGKKTYITAKYAVVNRIKDVYLADVQVKPIGATNTIVPSSTQSQTITNTVMVPAQQVATTTTQYVPAPPPATAKQTQDSLNTIIGFLKDRNLRLQDSITNLNARLAGSPVQKDSTVITTTRVEIKKKPHYPVMIVKPYVGIGLEHIPFVVNQDSVVQNSSTGASSHVLLTAGANLVFFSHSAISVEVNPYGSYGINLGSNICGNHVVLGGLLRVLAGMKYDAPIKLLVEGGFIYREGSWRKNLTVANPLVAGTYLKTQQSAGYEYNVFHVGGGIQYQWNAGNSYIRPAIFLEKPSMGSSTAILNIDAQVDRHWGFGISYGDNYFTAGTVKHPLTFTDDSQEYFSLKLLYKFKAL